MGLVVTKAFSRMLAGGDRRSTGEANRAAAIVLRQPQRLPELVECLWSDDPVLRMRGADAVEKISITRRDLIQPFAKELLGLAEECEQAELRWHLALMAPRLQLAPAARKRVIATLRRYLDDRSSIVRTCAIQGLAELSRGDTALEAEMIELLERCTRTGTAAMKARSRKLLKWLRANQSG